MKLFSRIYRSMLLLYERRFEPERLRPLAEDYWRVLLSGCLVGFVSVIIFGVMQFVGTLESLGSVSSAATAVPATLDRNKLQSLLSTYEQKQNDYSAAQRSSHTYRDPSN